MVATSSFFVDRVDFGKDVWGQWDVRMLLPLGWLIEFVLGCDSFFMFSFFIFLKMLDELVEDFDVFLSVEFPESLLLLPIVKISFLRLAAW